jgi:FKBP-type peptidyl-prolyl cis-trans isomerase FklB
MKPIRTSWLASVALSVATTLVAQSVSTAAAEGAVSAAPGSAATPTNPVTPETGSYDVGLLLGSQLAHSGLGPVTSLQALERGLKEALDGREPTPAERDAALGFMRDARAALAERNRAAGRVFLEHNAAQPGVVTTPSGLQYRVLVQGDPQGKSPALTDNVTVRYLVNLADGTELDRSDAHDQPARFRVNAVFKGWQEALLAMKPGAKWQVFVPSELGYGANTPPTIAPGALLVYELELLRIDPVAPVDPAAARRPPAPAEKPAVNPGSTR